MNFRALLAAAALALLTAGCVGLPDTSSRAWPIRTEEKTTGGDLALDVLWPLVHAEVRGDTTETALRPIARRVESEDSVRVEVLWPIYRYRKDPGREGTWLLPLFFDRTVTVEETDRVDRDWMLLPFFFGGSDSQEGDYFLFFPFWGTTKDLFGTEEIRWRMFPLYLETTDCEHEATHLLWPLIAWGEGGGRTSFRFLPFWSEKDVEGRSWSRSLLWPLFTWGESELQTDDPVSTFFFFPFYGRSASGKSWTTTILFPFFMFSGNVDGYHDSQVLWPIYRSMEAPDKSAFRLWPFYGHQEFRDEDGEVKSYQDYYLWPIVWDESFAMADGRHDVFQVVPFYRSSRYSAPDGGSKGSEVQVWPLFRDRTGADGSYRMRILAPIPFTNWDSFEAHWSWLYTLADYREVPGEGESLDLLFGLFQHRRVREESYTGIPLILEHADDGEDEKVHLLKGLLGWETSEDGGGLRLLWFLKIPF